MIEFTDLGPWGVPIPFRIIFDQSTGGGTVSSLAAGVMVVEQSLNGVVTLLNENTGLLTRLSATQGHILQAVLAQGLPIMVTHEAKGVVRIRTETGFIITLN